MFSSLVHLLLGLSISYPYLIEFHGFAYNIQQGMKHQMGGATLIYLIYIFITIRIGPFSNCENRSGFQFGCQVRTAQHWFQPLIPVFGLFQNQRTVGLDETLQNFIYKHTLDLENVQMNKE